MLAIPARISEINKSSIFEKYLTDSKEYDRFEIILKSYGQMKLSSGNYRLTTCR
jgi:hypothetical protein